MRLEILPEHGFKHKGNYYASLPWFGTKIAQKYAIKGSKYSGFRRDVKPHVLTFSTSGQRQATSGHNVWYMRSVVSKEMSRFRLPSSGRRRLLLKVPIVGGYQHAGEELRSRFQMLRSLPANRGPRALKS